MGVVSALDTQRMSLLQPQGAWALSILLRRSRRIDCEIMGEAEGTMVLVVNICRKTISIQTVYKGLVFLLLRG